MAKPLHIVFSGGGSGGHLFPGLAVAEQLSRENGQIRITFVGSGKRFERQQVALAGFEHLALPSRPWPKRPREAFRFVVDNLAGYLAASRFLDDHSVSAVVGLGGYASVPMARAAARRRVPLILLEQNAVAGRATRWLASSAQMTCIALPHARSQLRCRGAIRVTGNPVRRRFSAAFPPASLATPGNLGQTAPTPTSARPAAVRPILLILGGSSGARVLNEVVPPALYRVRDQLALWNIVHLAGEQGLEATAQLYRKLGLSATVHGFCGDMPSLLSETGLAVCRAGGTTLAELAIAGVPAVLVPYPHAADDHQRRNALVFEQAGAALVLDQRSWAGRPDHRMGDVLAGLLSDADQRRQMSLAMLRFGRPNAAAEVARAVLQTATGRQARPLRAVG